MSSGEVGAEAPAAQREPPDPEGEHRDQEPDERGAVQHVPAAAPARAAAVARAAAARGGHAQVLPVLGPAAEGATGTRLARPFRLYAKKSSVIKLNLTFYKRVFVLF